MIFKGLAVKREPSAVVPPGFYFQPSPRKPIHPLSPFQFKEKFTPGLPHRDVPSPSSVPLPSPPRESRDFDVEQAFLEREPPVSDDWQLTFEAEETEEEEEEAVVAEGQTKVRFSGGGDDDDDDKYG